MQAVTAREMAKRVAGGGCLVGLDVGTRFVGVAISSADCQVASPLGLLVRSKLRRESPHSSDAHKLQHMVEGANVVGLVVGYPAELTGLPNQATVSVRAFLRQLGTHACFCGKPFVLWDERYSSLAAEKMLQLLDLEPVRKKAIVDKFSAVFILQGCLDAIQRHRAGNGGA